MQKKYNKMSFLNEIYGDWNGTESFVPCNAICHSTFWYKHELKNWTKKKRQTYADLMSKYIVLMVKDQYLKTKQTNNVFKKLPPLI